MQPSSKSQSVFTYHNILQGIGIVLMLALLAGSQSQWLVDIYDWLQVSELSLLSLF